jgi:hypothetical protein
MKILKDFVAMILGLPEDETPPNATVWIVCGFVVFLVGVFVMVG